MVLFKIKYILDDILIDGHDFEEFTKKYTCSICFEFVYKKKLYKCKNRHFTCNECFNKSFEASKKKICISCSSENTLVLDKQSRNIDDKFSKKLVFCPNRYKHDNNLIKNNEIPNRILSNDFCFKSYQKLLEKDSNKEEAESTTYFKKNHPYPIFLYQNRSKYLSGRINSICSILVQVNLNLKTITSNLQVVNLVKEIDLHLSPSKRKSLQLEDIKNIQNNLLKLSLEITLEESGKDTSVIYKDTSYYNKFSQFVKSFGKPNDIGFEELKNFNGFLLGHYDNDIIIEKEIKEKQDKILVTLMGLIKKQRLVCNLLSWAIEMDFALYRYINFDKLSPDIENGCKESMKFDELESHLESCQSNYEKCIFNEKERLNNFGHKEFTFTCKHCKINNIKILSVHIETDCPHTIIHCKYKDGGCNGKFKRSEMYNHLSTINHSVYMGNLIDKQELELKKQENKLAELLESNKRCNQLLDQQPQLFKNQSNKYESKWVIDNFTSKIVAAPSNDIYSPQFNVGQNYMRIKIIPNNNGYLSIYLIPERPVSLPTFSIAFNLVNNIKGKNLTAKFEHKLLENDLGKGYRKFLDSRLLTVENGYISNTDELTIEFSVGLIHQ